MNHHKIGHFEIRNDFMPYMKAAEKGFLFRKALSLIMKQRRKTYGVTEALFVYAVVWKHQCDRHNTLHWTLENLDVS